MVVVHTARFLHIGSKWDTFGTDVVFAFFFTIGNVQLHPLAAIYFKLLSFLYIFVVLNITMLIYFYLIKLMYIYISVVTLQ